MGLRSKLGLEWDSIPLLNPEWEKVDSGDKDNSQRVILVCICPFFTDKTSFVYCIKGKANISKFYLATYSGKPYDRPCFATPLTVSDPIELCSSVQTQATYDEASKTDTKGLKWKFLWETGMRAWESLVYSPEKLAEIRWASTEDTDFPDIAEKEEEAKEGDPPKALTDEGEDPAHALTDEGDDTSGAVEDTINGSGVLSDDDSDSSDGQTTIIH
ncbi:hypothetical protein CC80DRAFT_134901 [Byssothecium circinans]|uniref:Uncharacterized protein n=1 Tax=Byssothecium circinans TaxID=147558 RepID=A0A6A5TQR6_9PLEO|nr:hypothetical protein CC80DRAFT_134901 [Byssothecium circinans]